ncbi:MAG TPA: GNAT family N-acetyltransferase [Geobacteraceae bacterium]|nr:GNAT family N-acetyltransferase [Geobacteraceae bacterium]
MIINFFQHEDVNAFLALAAEEHWICSRWELDFLLRQFPQGCMAARLDEGPIAFITSVKYGSSGWIGNLVVRGDRRGNGIGSALMERTLQTLMDAGTRTIWLTASEKGRPIYERLGFRAIDRIGRWYGIGDSGGIDEPGDYSMAGILAVDWAGWGDMRDSIIAESIEVGMLMARDGGFLICQPGTGGMQVGPWGSTCRETASLLLDTARSRAGADMPLYLDVPESNDDATRLLRSRGFSERGGSLLMYLGERPVYGSRRIYALASMGSMG